MPPPLPARPQAGFVGVFAGSLRPPPETASEAAARMADATINAAAIAAGGLLVLALSLSADWPCRRDPRALLWAMPLCRLIGRRVFCHL